MRKNHKNRRSNWRPGCKIKYVRGGIIKGDIQSTKMMTCTEVPWASAPRMREYFRTVVGPGSVKRRVSPEWLEGLIAGGTQ